MKTHSLCGRLFPQRRLFFVYFDPVRTFKVRTEEGVTRGTPLVGFFGSFLVRTRNEHILKLKYYFNAYFFYRKEIGERNCKERNLWVSLLDLTSTPRFLRDRGENGSRVKARI